MEIHLGRPFSDGNLFFSVLIEMMGPNHLCPGKDLGKLPILGDSGDLYHYVRIPGIDDRAALITCQTLEHIPSRHFFCLTTYGSVGKMCVFAMNK